MDKFGIIVERCLRDSQHDRLVRRIMRLLDLDYFEISLFFLTNSSKIKILLEMLLVPCATQACLIGVLSQTAAPR